MGPSWCPITCHQAGLTSSGSASVQWLTERGCFCSSYWIKTTDTLKHTSVNSLTTYHQDFMALWNNTNAYSVVSGFWTLSFFCIEAGLHAFVSLEPTSWLLWWVCYTKALIMQLLSDWLKEAVSAFVSLEPTSWLLWWVCYTKALIMQLFSDWLKEAVSVVLIE